MTLNKNVLHPVYESMARDIAAAVCGFIPDETYQALVEGIARALEAEARLNTEEEFWATVERMKRVIK